jgi:predicted GIY-YIG superfamily endonuclease
MWFVYVLRCNDGSVYIGQTDNLNQRLSRHNAGTAAAHTAKRRPVRVIYAEAYPTREECLRRERQLKGWTRAKKELAARVSTVVERQPALCDEERRADARVLPVLPSGGMDQAQSRALGETAEGDLDADVAMPIEVKPIVAERSLRTADAAARSVQLRVGMPRPSRKGDWECPYQIVGLGKSRPQVAYGLDGIQALLMAN